MRANATIIGAFVLGAIVLLVAGILFFGSGTLLQKRIPIVSFFRLRYRLAGRRPGYLSRRARG